MYLQTLIGTGNDDTAMVQTAFDDLRTLGGILELQGQFNVSKLNFTNNHTVSVRGLGVGCTIIRPIGTVNAVIDISGSYFMNLSNFRLGMPDNGVVPTVGILGLQTVPIQSNWLRFSNLFVDGKYEVAVVYICGVASSKMDSCAFWQRNPGKYCMILTSDNFVGLQSEYTTAELSGPMSDWLFSGCEIHHYNEPGETPGYAMMLRGARQIKFDSGNMSGGANELVTVETAGDGTDCANLVFDKQTYYGEPGQPQFGCVFNPIEQPNRYAIETRSCYSTGPLFPG